MFDVDAFSEEGEQDERQMDQLIEHIEVKELRSSVSDGGERMLKAHDLWRC